MKDTILGLECEYGVYLLDTKTGKPPNDNNGINKFADLFALVGPERCPPIDFIENGGRLYKDTGEHPEFAMPECSTVYEAVKYLRSGNEIMYECQMSLENEFKKHKREIKIIFRADNKTVNPKNLEDYNSHGTHENYLIRRKTFQHIPPNDGNIKKYLLTFFITRQIYTGSGSIFIKNKNNSYPQGYVISPRAFFIEKEIGFGTTSERAIINSKDESHTYQEELARLHIICGDTNRSDWSNWLKIGITSLVISILDKQPAAFKGLPVIQDGMSLKVFRKISEERDPKNKNPYWDDYPALSPIEVQKYYLEKAGEYVSKISGGSEERQIIDEWTKILVMLERNDEELCQILDWKIKENFLQEYAARKAIKAADFHDYKLAQIDLKYHDLGPNSIFEILEKNGHIKRIISDEEVLDGMINPPPTTRALAR